MFGTLLVMADFATVFISPVIFSSKRGSVCMMHLITDDQALDELDVIVNLEIFSTYTQYGK